MGSTTRCHYEPLGQCHVDALANLIYKLYMLMNFLKFRQDLQFEAIGEARCWPSQSRRRRKLMTYFPRTTSGQLRIFRSHI